MSSLPFPILGSGMWAWTISKKTAFELLDTFYNAGHRQVDMATNYPINKNPKDWRAAEKILTEWIKVNGIKDLEVWIKVGSLNNLFTPEHNLHPSFLYLALDYYQNLYKSNLHTFGIHWDNRTKLNDISNTLLALKKIQEHGLQLGLSGIKHPELYAQLNQQMEQPLHFRIQMKHNILYSDYKRYMPLHAHAQFTAYGINAGGLKLSPKKYSVNSYLATRGGDPLKENPILPKVRILLAQANKNTTRPTLDSFHQISLIYAFYAQQMEAILLGASTPQQLKNSLDFIENLKQYNFQEVKNCLEKIK